MAYETLIDAPSALIVLGGTLAATLLRCGWRDCGVALAVLVRLPRRRFDAARVRAELAVQVQEIRQDGLVRAQAHRFGDREFDEATRALIESRSLPALLARHEAHKAWRRRVGETAAQVYGQAAEMAPVFGLAGTLVSLSRLPSGGLEQAALGGAISMAVLTTLYGLLAANLAFAPLSRAVERGIAREEAERQALFDWLARQVEGSVAVPAGRPVASAAA